MVGPESISRGGWSCRCHWLPDGVDWSEPVLVDALERAAVLPRCETCGRATVIRIARADRQHPMRSEGGVTHYPVLLLCPLRAEGVVIEPPVGDGNSRWWARCDWGMRIGELKARAR